MPTKQKWHLIDIDVIRKTITQWKSRLSVVSKEKAELCNMDFC